MDRKFTLLATLFCVCLIASNIFEAKIFMVGRITLTGGFLVFPLSYIINDVLSEIYGYRNTRFVIWTAFALNAFFIAATQIVRILPEAPYGEAQEHLDFLFRMDMRISIASMAAFVCGSLLNSKVMVSMKKIQGEKGFGWRAVVSSFIGEAADSLIFFPIAFWSVGLKNMAVLMITQIILKTSYEIIVLPLTWSVVKKMSGNIRTT